MLRHVEGFNRAALVAGLIVTSHVMAGAAPVSATFTATMTARAEITSSGSWSPPVDISPFSFDVIITFDDAAVARGGSNGQQWATFSLMSISGIPWSDPGEPWPLPPPTSDTTHGNVHESRTPTPYPYPWMEGLRQGSVSYWRRLDFGAGDSWELLSQAWIQRSEPAYTDAGDVGEPSAASLIDWLGGGSAISFSQYYYFPPDTWGGGYQYTGTLRARTEHVPEPSVMVLLGAGLAALGVVRTRRRDRVCASD